MGHAATSKTKKAGSKRKAPGDFLDIGRKVSESGVIWQRESGEEQEDAEGHSDFSHTERNESESVNLPPDEEETGREDAHQQVDFFYPESREPEPHVFRPGPAFWDFEANPLPPVTRLKPQKASLISKLSKLSWWRRESSHCTQEKTRTSRETVYAARCKELLIVLPWKADRWARQRSETDRRRTTNESEHSSQHRDRQSSVDTSLHRSDTVTSTADSRVGQTSDGEHESGCYVCRFKPLRSSQARCSGS